MAQQVLNFVQLALGFPDLGSLLGFAFVHSIEYEAQSTLLSTLDLCYLDFDEVSLICGAPLVLTKICLIL